MRAQTLKIAAVSLALSVAGALPALAQAPGPMQDGTGPRWGYGYHPHMWEGGYYGFHGPLMWIGLLILIGLVVWAIARFAGCGGGRCRHRRHGRSDALAILEERFAKGEIEADEFEKRRNLLGDR